ncbi:B12-binding domain-containing radical SAM protein [Patescibacteria group bacterium]
MKVYLVNPPASNGIKIVREGRCMQRSGAWTAVWPPISLAIIAAVLEKEKITVKLDDCIVNEIDFPKLLSKLKLFKPDLVIINTATPSIDTDIKVANLAKKANSKCLTVAFGIHVSALPNETLKSEKSLDCVVRGEPELTIKQMAIALKNGKSYKKIRGLSYKDNKEIIHNPNRPFLKNLDKLPFPAWHLINKNRYLMPFKNVPFVLIATSRGCPYQCKFCADSTFYGKRLRLRSPKSIVDEIEWVKDKFAIKDFLFWSESFTINARFALEVANEIIKRKIKVNWVCNSRADNVNYSMLKKFSQAGCWMIGFGIESGDQKILDLMNKNISLKQISKAVSESQRAGLEVTGHCLIGYPGESKKTIQKTITFVKKLKLNFVQFYCAVPFPGSDLFKIAKKRGLLTTNNWRFFEQNYSIITTPKLAADQIMKLRSKAYRSFYFRPQIYWQTLKRIRSFSDLKKLFSMIKDFITWI